jgi:COP9 signalosome complex subunit 6
VLTAVAAVRIIHTSPQLDLVGWYTVLPKSGPTPSIVPIHNWILTEHNESSLLLAFHPEEAVDHSVGSRLPLTIYESNYEVDEPKADQGEDREMRDGEPQLKLKFRELPYSVETGEAEMISMDFVARGAGNATVVEARQQQKPTMVAVDTDPKGKRRILSPEKSTPLTSTSSDEPVLSQRDEELIASLTAKSNAIKMLQSRIKLLITYLEQLPPSFLSGDSNSTAAEQETGAHTTPSPTILRLVQALVNRLGLVVPSATKSFEQEMLSEANDVNLMSLLNEVMQSAVEAHGIGKKHHTVETAKMQQRRSVMPDLAGSSFTLPEDLQL